MHQCAGQVNVVFQDQFTTPGTKLNTAAWTTETGPASFLGRTQLADWVTAGGVGQFVVDANGARLALSTYNPTGFSLYGTHGKTIQTFRPTAGAAIEFTTRLQLQSIPKGLVFGMYFYGCTTPATCATQHNEIDIEVVTNVLQAGAPPQVQLNWYANEPLGAGNGGLVGLPAGFDPLAAHDWTIRWALDRIDFLVDGVLLGKTTTKVPQEAMQVNLNVWGPAPDWAAAYDASLQPVTNAGQSQTFAAYVRSVEVKQVPNPQRLRFVPLAPCRLMETRPEYNFEGRTGSFGPPFLNAGETRTLSLPNSNVCSIPASAKAAFVNVTAVPRGPLDFVTVYPAGELKPDTWTVRSLDSQIVANSTIVKLQAGAVSVHATQATDLLLDVFGYFTEPSAVEPNLVFYPITPCRVVETRAAYSSLPAPYGPPAMNAGDVRRVRFPSSPNCTVPVGAAAYSLNLTAVPPQPLAFMTLWPAGGGQPNVSNINSFAGRTLTNHVVVPVGTNDSIDFYAYNKTDFLIDINGYFALDDGVNGLYYYPVTQARLFDSRAANGPCGGPMFADESQRTISISACGGTPAGARAYHISATSLSSGLSMPFLTVWPSGVARPNASMLNAFEGQVVTNSVTVPAGQGGSIDVFAYRRTNVVVDLNGYFAR